MSRRFLYHWSPVERHQSILEHGLKPGSLSTDGEWRPPYVCLADSPSLAWALSGMTWRGQEHPLWDLWITDLAPLVDLDGYTEYELVMQDTGGEYRFRTPIPAPQLWWVGSRPSLKSP